MHNAWAAAKFDTTLRTGTMNDGTSINVTTGFKKVTLFGESDVEKLTDAWAADYKDAEWTKTDRNKHKVPYDVLRQHKLSDILNFVIVRYVYDQLKDVLTDLPKPKVVPVNTSGGKCIKKTKKSPAKGKKDGSVRRR